VAVQKKKSEGFKILNRPGLDHSGYYATVRWRALEKMEVRASARNNWREAHRIWYARRQLDRFICAVRAILIPSGMRLLAYVKNRFVDVIVMSGAVLYHDIHTRF